MVSDSRKQGLIFFLCWFFLVFLQAHQMLWQRQWGSLLEELVLGIGISTKLTCWNMELWASDAWFSCWTYFKYWDCWRFNFFDLSKGNSWRKWSPWPQWPVLGLLRTIIALLYWLPWWFLHMHRAAKYKLILSVFGCSWKPPISRPS